MKRLFIAAAFALVGLPALAQQQLDFSTIEVKTTKLSGSVYEMEGAGGNLGVLVGEDGVFLVDSSFAPMADKIKAAIAKLSAKPLRILVNTHVHGDHIGGNEAMAQAGAVIIAHENLRARMMKPSVNGAGQAVPPAPPGALPVITYTDRATLHLNGETIEIVHLPAAHTDGDTAVYFKTANVFQTGDIFRTTGYQRIDVVGGGSLKGMIAAYDSMIAMINDKTKVIPGHGTLSKRSDLKAVRDMLETVRARVQKLVDEGKTEDEAVAAKPTADLDGKWIKGGPINGDAMTRMAYQSITGKLPPPPTLGTAPPAPPK